jgi:3',5'-cyclic AMP phosphodiesterase CpdA
MLAAAAWLVAGKDPKLTPREIHMATRMPDRVVLTWSGDPATTQSVTWRTDTSADSAMAEIAEATDGPQFKKAIVRVAAKSETFVSNLGEARYHSATFTGLKPGTDYVYRVGDGFNYSEWNQFRTASSKPAPVSFLYVGDSQNDIYEMWSRVIRSGYSDAPKAQFIIHAGDLINTAERDEQWGEWHRAAGWINRSVPVFPVPGNHEYGRVGNEERSLNRHWRPQFTLPGNGVAGLEETNYSVDIQGVRMIALNSNVRQKEQAAWLDALLAGNPNRWTVITFHHPIFSAARGRDNKELREMWQPVFDKYKVDLVLTGHDHTYARSNLVSGMNTRSGNTVYVVSVSGPKMYQVEREPWMQRAAEDTQLYQIVRIDGGRLEYEARTARGVLYDAFELQKQGPGRPNKLVNRTPRTPELRRPPEQPSGG